jgi:hypothetical protein
MGVNLYGVGKVEQFFAMDWLVLLAVLSLENSVRSDVVASSLGASFAVGVNPLFMPYPGMTVEAEKFTAMVFWNGAKELSANFSFVTDKVAVKFRFALLLAARYYRLKKFSDHAASCWP